MTQIDNERSVCRYAIDGVTPSRATYLAVAEATDRDPMDLPPLMDTIDADALDAFIDRGSDTVGSKLTFEYAGCSVTVTTEEVTVEMHDVPSEPRDVEFSR